MLATYSELGRSTPKENSATKGGPLTRRGSTPHLVTICFLVQRLLLFYILGYVTCGEQKNVSRGIIMQRRGIRMVSLNVNGMNNMIKRGKSVNKI